VDIVFAMDHVFRADSPTTDDDMALACLLECMVNVDRAVIRRARPPLPLLYRSGVRYARCELWLPVPALYRAKGGDCKSLAPARAAEIIEFDRVPAKCVHRWFRRADGGKDFHILIEVNGEVWEDPSKRLGMTDSDFAEWL
jgi:hypothetical protein